MGELGYLRYPHVARDLITFVAEDDVWLASMSEAVVGGGTQAQRLSTDRVPVLHPRLEPVGYAGRLDFDSRRHPLAGRMAPKEAYAASVGGGPCRRLTYWGNGYATVRGWVNDR